MRDVFLRFLRCVALFSLMMVGLAGCQAGGGGGQGQAIAGISLAGRSDATLVVQGLSCPLCAHNLDKLLLKVDGVQTAVVNLADGTVLVGFDASRPPETAALAKAVADAGFTLITIR